MISEPMIYLAQTVHLSCTDTNTVSKWTEAYNPRRLGVPSGASKMIFEPYGTFGANHAPILRQD
jgi:hypothetical protein